MTKSRIGFPPQTSDPIKDWRFAKPGPIAKEFAVTDAAGSVVKKGGMPQERGGAGLLNDEVARGRSSLNERAKPVSRDMPQVYADVMGGV
jgi:hypothetical protein